jgi:hypothetical protein
MLWRFAMTDELLLSLSVVAVVVQPASASVAAATTVPIFKARFIFFMVTCSFCLIIEKPLAQQKIVRMLLRDSFPHAAGANRF